jgi:protein ImuB
VKLASEVDHVELRVAVVGRLGKRQGELFTDRWLSDPHQLAVLVNRLSSRLGYDRVLRAELGKSPLPERAVKWVPAVQRTMKKLQIAKCKLQNANWKGNKRRSFPAMNNLQFRAPPEGWSCNLQSPPRPLLLYPTPQAMEVVCVAPDGPPQFVWLRGRRESIVGCVGPERIETLWWRGPAVRRDYYRVATESGDHLWMFRRLMDGRWFVHGEFE